MNSEIQQIDKEIQRLEERKRFLRRIPSDPYPSGTIITFEKRFSETRYARVYLYAAIKADGFWYTTGPKRNGPWRWEDLMKWIQGDLHTLKLVTGTVHIRPQSDLDW